MSVVRRAPGRPPRHETDNELKDRYNALRRVQARFERAERDRDEAARAAIEHGLSVHAVGKVLGVDAATAWRRYRRERAA